MATALSDFAFTSSLTNFQCPTHYSGWLCPPPSACARDANTGRVYCCNQQQDNICWTIPIECTNNGSTLDCKNADQIWCCVNERENCVRAVGRYNICLSKANDVLFGLSAKVLNATYSSLASASPTASSYPFDPARLGSQTASSSSTSTTSTGTTASTPDSTSSGQTTVTVGSNSNSTSLSGGAIGGIVVGAVIAVTMALGALYFLLRRNRSQQTPEAGARPPASVEKMPPADSILEADRKPANPATAPVPAGYSERAYEADSNVVATRTSPWSPTYPTGPMDQVHEVDGMASSVKWHELPGR